MASVTMAASFMGGAATFATTSQRRLVITNSVKADAMKASTENKQDDVRSSNGRREMVFAAAAAALCSVAGVAMADEPKRGTAAAKKAYNPVCVANPTARICNY